MSQPKNVVVTGGSGRAGRMVIAELREHGYDPVNFDRVDDEGLGCRFMQGELSQPDRLVEAFQGADAVIHLAAVPSGKDGTPSEIIRTNIEGTFNVMEAMVQCGVKKIVFASSIVVYGVDARWMPPDYLPIDEAHPLNAIPIYPMSKIMCETLIEGYVNQHDVSAISLRLGNFTHGRDIFDTQSAPERLATNVWFSKVLGPDLGQAFRLALESDIRCDAFNICTKYRYTESGEIDNGPDVEARAKETGAKRIAPSLLQGASAFSSEKAERVLGYKPQM